jgi:nitroreductase
MEEGLAVISGEESIHCGHCRAACPADAIEVSVLDDDALDFDNLTLNPKWLPHGRYDAAELARLMASRRSCRNFTDQPVDRTLLQDLVKFGITAPSGTNCQMWSFTIFPNRAAVDKLAEKVMRFFVKLNQTADKAYLRKFMKWIGKPELEGYYLNYRDKVQEALDEYVETGRDRLFHGAPAVIVVSDKIEASCSAEDALLASQNMLLAAHALGLGTCLIGFAVEAMKNDPSIRSFIGLPADERAYTVIAVGWPDETYEKTIDRQRVQPRWFEG